MRGLDIDVFVSRVTCFQVKDYFLVDSKDPSSVMQIDLCGGVFGLPEFAKAPPVHTFASILEAELKEARQPDQRVFSPKSKRVLSLGARSP